MKITKVMGVLLISLNLACPLFESSSGSGSNGGDDGNDTNEQSEPGFLSVNNSVTGFPVSNGIEIYEDDPLNTQDATLVRLQFENTGGGPLEIRNIEVETIEGAAVITSNFESEIEIRGESSRYGDWNIRPTDYGPIEVEVSMEVEQNPDGESDLEVFSFSFRGYSYGKYIGWSTESGSEGIEAELSGDDLIIAEYNNYLPGFIEDVDNAQSGGGFPFGGQVNGLFDDLSDFAYNND